MDGKKHLKQTRTLLGAGLMAAVLSHGFVEGRVEHKMRKTQLSPSGSAAPKDWLDLEQAARVEVSSEAEGYPVEGALLKDVQREWRAREPGKMLSGSSGTSVRPLPRPSAKNTT